MKLRDIAKKLTSEGYQIKYRERKDGGILITSINGKKFTGGAGNIYARQLTGETLSSGRYIQLKTITAERTSLFNLYKEYRKVKRKWTQANLPKSSGKLTFKKFKRAIQEKGKEEALRYLGEKEKYASGIAYSKNVEALASYIEQLASFTEEDELYDLAEELRNNADTIRDEWIEPSYNELYRFNTEPLTEELVREVTRNVRRILRLA